MNFRRAGVREVRVRLWPCAFDSGTPRLGTVPLGRTVRGSRTREAKAVFLPAHPTGAILPSNFFNSYNACRIIHERLATENHDH